MTVLERDKALQQASQAAAGMLAVEDPENPVELAALSRLSMDRYAGFLAGIESLAGLPVPFQTSLTLQAVEGNTNSETERFPPGFQAAGRTFRSLAEHSLDPRQLAAALDAAVRATSIRLLEETPVLSTTESADGVTLQTRTGEIHTEKVVHAMGAWSMAPVAPRKGQMLAVQTPAEVTIDYVVRTPDIYAVPRLQGPRAGQIVIGATVEDAGFSTTTNPASLLSLRAMAAEFLPILAEEEACPALNQWAGLRPTTPDHLPLLGWSNQSRRTMIATGHYRNGILLAPGTAQVVADLLEGRQPKVCLTAFSPDRFR